MVSAPVPGAAAREAAMNSVIPLLVDGVRYEFRPGDVSGKQTGLLRKQAGMSVQAVMKAASDDPDLDIIAAIMTLARWQAGEDITFDEVADSISYTSTIEIGESEDDQADEDDSPGV